MSFTKEEIKNLVQTNVSDLNNQGNENLKHLIETRDEMVQALDQLNSKNGKSSDEEIRFSNSLTAKIRQIDNKIEVGKKDEQRQAGNSVPYGNSEPGRFNSGLTGGRALNEKGTIRLYAPHQRLVNDFSTPRGNDVSLGAYLRAVVDKPRNAAEREIIQNSVTSDNYELPVHIAGELIDRLRAVNPLLREGGAGSRTVTLEGGDTKFMRINSDPNAIWHAEMTEETPSDPVFEGVTMSPKTVLSMTEIGRETLQDSANVEEALTTAFVGSLNDTILTATFTGSGANTPEGLATVVTQTEEYANAGSPDQSNFVNASKTLHDNNVPDDNRSFIHAPDVWQTLALITDDNSRYQDAPSFIRDVPNFVSSGVTAGEAYTGDFSNVVYGFRLEINIEQYRAALAKSYGSLWVAAARLDIATFRPSALVRIEEAAAQILSFSGVALASLLTFRFVAEIIAGMKYSRFFYS